MVTLWQAWRARSLQFAFQRLGLAAPQRVQPHLWVHCASVGEINAALPLIKKFADTGSGVVVTTTTATGATALLNRKLSGVEHQFLPIDFAIRRAYRSIRPSALVIVETEIWPNLIYEGSNRRIPMVIVNARLSGKTLNSPAWLQAVYRATLSKINAIFAKSESDAESFIKLGADPSGVRVMGNLKYASVQVNKKAPQRVLLRPFWLAASTHDNEEEQLCASLKEYPACAKTLLVIAPRHPHRSEKIQQMLKRQGLSFSVRSKGDVVTTDTRVYLADKLGEMDQWFAHAEVVFMGGSLVPVGGHNLLEPASWGAAMVAGNNLQNCLEDANIFVEAGALVKADTVGVAMQAIERLLIDEESRHAAGAAAISALSHGTGVESNNGTDLLQMYTTAVLELMNQSARQNK